MNEILTGDCANILLELPEESIDLTVTSPPYDTMRDYHGYTFNFPVIASRLWRVTKPGGVVVWVVGDETVNGSESGTSHRQSLFFMDIGFKLFDTMIYEKTGLSQQSKDRYSQQFEYMFVLSKGMPKTFNPIRDVPKLWAGSYAPTTTRQKDGSLKVKKSKNAGMAKLGRAPEIMFTCPCCGYEGKLVEAKYGFKERNNIWRIVNGKKYAHTDTLVYEHPASFPESLAAGHIISWTNCGDTVLDPMCGSGTTLKMAKLYGRNYIGIDISKKYCELARKRVALVTNKMITEALEKEKEMLNGSREESDGKCEDAGEEGS